MIPSQSRPRECGRRSPFSPAAAARRGGAYVFFLCTALLVTVIGMSALTVVRVRQRIVEGVTQAAAADLYAQAAVDAARLAIYSNSGWRTQFLHDSWSVPQSMGDGTLAWKVKDEVSGSLTADSNALVRVFGKGVCGSSTMVYSALLQPPVQTVPAQSILNGDFESGSIAPWTSTDCSVSLDSANRYKGAAALRMSQRISAAAAARQSLASSVRTNATYRVSAWIRTQTSPESINLTLRIQSNGGWTSFPIATLAATTAWQAVEGTVTPIWSGALQAASLEIAGTTLTQDILIDSVSLRYVPKPVGIIPGTWRREAQ